MLNDDSEHYTGNGTVIIESPVRLDEPSFALDKEENFLVLKYLRDADGIEDIDISITQQEYVTKKQKELEKYSALQNKQQDESIKYDVTTIDEESAKKIKNRGRLSEGTLWIKINSDLYNRKNAVYSAKPYTADFIE